MTDVFSKVHFNTSDFKFKEIILDSLKHIPELKHVVVIEDIGEAVDPSLKPLIGQHIYARFSSLDFREAYKNFCFSHLTAFFPNPSKSKKYRVSDCRFQARARLTSTTTAGMAMEPMCIIFGYR